MRRILFGRFSKKKKKKKKKKEELELGIYSAISIFSLTDNAFAD
jgi:hypothetical protein